MTDRKAQLGNVAFGGNWLEEILITEELQNVLHIVEMAAQDCADRDVQTEEFLEAMLYVRKNIEKGPMLTGAMFKALVNPDQEQRRHLALDVARMVRLWAGL